MRRPPGVEEGNERHPLGAVPCPLPSLHATAAGCSRSQHLTAGRMSCNGHATGALGTSDGSGVDA
eukprot:353880-Chlamydomonas_euryale.AAC.23